MCDTHQWPKFFWPMPGPLFLHRIFTRVLITSIPNLKSKASFMLKLMNYIEKMNCLERFVMHL